MNRLHIVGLVLLLLFFASAPAQAQKKKKAVEKDTIQVPFFHGVSVHVDLVGAGALLWSDHGQYEAGLRVNLKDRYFPVFEFGMGKANEQEDYVEESWCKVKAQPYFRIGCDFNLLRDKHDNYKLYIGLRYAYTSFKYSMTVKEEDLTSFLPDEGTADTGDDGDEEVSGTIYRYEEYDDLRAKYHWLEFALGVDAKVWGPLHLGWDFRYQRVLAKKWAEEGRPWYIPGLGNRKKGGFTVAFNVILSF